MLEGIPWPEKARFWDLTGDPDFVSAIATPFNRSIPNERCPTCNKTTVGRKVWSLTLLAKEGRPEFLGLVHSFDCAQNALENYFGPFPKEDTGGTLPVEPGFSFNKIAPVPHVRKVDGGSVINGRAYWMGHIAVHIHRDTRFGNRPNAENYSAVLYDGIWYWKTPEGQAQVI